MLKKNLSSFVFFSFLIWYFFFLSSALSDNEFLAPFSRLAAMKRKATTEGTRVNKKKRKDFNDVAVVNKLPAGATDKTRKRKKTQPIQPKSTRNKKQKTTHDEQDGNDDAATGAGNVVEKRNSPAKRNNIPGSELSSVYSFPKSNLTAEELIFHKKQLTFTPINAFDERTRPKNWKKGKPDPLGVVAGKNSQLCFAETDKYFAVPAYYGYQWFGRH